MEIRVKGSFYREWKYLSGEWKGDIYIFANIRFPGGYDEDARKYVEREIRHSFRSYHWSYDPDDGYDLKIGFEMHPETKEEIERFSLDEFLQNLAEVVKNALIGYKREKIKESLTFEREFVFQGFDIT